MAYIAHHKPRNCKRVIYHLNIKGTKVRKSPKYAKTQDLAKLLQAELELLERATEQGYASEEAIEGWIEKGYIKQPEAVEAFRYYGDLVVQRERVGVSQTDYDAIFSTIEDRSARESKGGPGEKVHAVRMFHTRKIRDWLKDTYPDLHRLTEEGVKDRRRELEADWAPNTIRDHFTKFRQFLDEAVHQGMIGHNPALYVRVPRPKVVKPRRVLEEAEIEFVGMVASLKANEGKLWGGLPVIKNLGLGAGLRQGEMRWLTWPAIGWKTGIIDLMETKCKLTGQVWVPKGKKRRLDVPSELLETLDREQHRQEAEGTLGYFVLHNPRYDKPVHEDTIDQAWNRAMKKTREDEGVIEWLNERNLMGKVDDITPHTFRHTYCTDLLRQGVDLETVRDRMGHEDIKTTETYLREIEPEEHPTDVLSYRKYLKTAS